MTGSTELNLRILSSISPTLLSVSINICSQASLHLNSVKERGGVRALMGQESARLKTENLRSDGRDSLAKPSFNEEPEAQGGGLAFGLTAA